MRRIVFLLVLSAWAATARAQITLDAYRDSVCGYSWRLKNAAAAVDGAYETMLREKTGFLPEVSASGSFAKTFHEMAGNRLWGFSVQPRVVQTVYGGGGVRASFRRAESGYAAALCEEERAMLDVRYLADYAYWNVSAMQLFVAATEEYVGIIESLYRVVEHRFGEGYIAKSDLLQVETRLSDAEYRLESARRSYAEVLHDFNSLLGADTDREAELAQSITDSIGMPARASTAEMMARRPDLRAAEAYIRSAEYGAETVRASFLPQVSVGTGGSWQTFSPNASGRTYLDASLTVAVSVPLFHWGERRRAEVAAMADVRRSCNDLGQARDDALREEADGWSALASSYSQMRSSLRSLKIAGENLEISTYSYNEGQATVLDVLQAQLSWIQIYTNAITAQFNYAVAVSAYERITAGD